MTYEGVAGNGRSEVKLIIFVILLTITSKVDPMVWVACALCVDMSHRHPCASGTYLIIASIIAVRAD